MNYIDHLAQAIENEISPESRPDQNGQRLYRLYALLALVKGIDVTLPDVHNAWSIWMAETNPDHPALVPFEELGEDVQDEDRPFAQAIRNVAQKMSFRS